VHVVGLQVRIGSNDLGLGHAVRDHYNDRGDGDPHTADAWDAAHLVWAHSDPREAHERRVLPSHAGSRTMMGACLGGPGAVGSLRREKPCRISEALALTETDVDARRGALLIRHGKGDKRREAGMDDWGFEPTRPQQHRCSVRSTLPIPRHRLLVGHAVPG